MGFAKSFKSAPTIRPMLNIGCLFDIPTGRYVKGKHGESILIGGVPYLTGIGGRGNSFKSALAFFMFLRVMDRYAPAEGNIYDTEMSGTLDRLKSLSWYMKEHLKEDDLSEDSERIVMSDKTVYSGNEWYQQLKDVLKEDREDKKQRKNYELTVPWVDTKGNHPKALSPALFIIDSFSQFTTDSLAKIQANEIGEAGRNVEALRDAMAKNQMIMELPGVTARTGAFGIMTAHMGDEHQLDPYAPPQKKLAFLKQAVKFKNVPEKFTFLPNNVWFSQQSKVLYNQGTKGPEYPRHTDDNMKGDPDLMEIAVLNLRAKSGPSGLPIPLVVSQREGILPFLSEFHYIKGMERFGIGGNLQHYYLELVPDVSLSRTTVRGKVQSDPKLQRALEITSEMCQMKHLWHDLPQGFVPTPGELYESLKKKGYDWDRLLNTRGWWTFEEQKEELPFLSTMDLLKMRAGEYHPYWYDKGK